MGVAPTTLRMRNTILIDLKRDHFKQEGGLVVMVSCKKKELN